VVEQLSAVAVSQATQVSPSKPHAANDGGSMHTPLAQQPFGHDASLQVHVPPSHTVPAPQGGLVPHMHVPVAASQVSALVAGQATQLTPAMPHVLDDGAWHPLAEQQPFGHERPSQTQLPPAQRLPVPQAGWVPQLQVPAAEQLSARAGSHDTQAAPFVPQATSEGMLQFEPEQHPKGHEVAVQLLQTPLMHAPVLPQSWHAAPPLPQAVDSTPVRHTPSFEQHPVGHDVPSHTQAAFTQRLPSEHIGPLPHRQLPPVLQRSALVPQSRQAPPSPPHELTA